MNTQDILSQSGRSSFFVNFILKDSMNPQQMRKDFSLFCQYYESILNHIKQKNPDSLLKCSFGISRNFWNQLFPNTPPPKHLKEFKEIKGKTYTAPATEGDFFLHIRSQHPDVCYDVLRQFIHFLNPFLENVYEIHGFSNVDGKAVIGFADGNPDQEKNILDYVLIGKEDEKYESGCYLFTQQYLHDIEAWDGLTIDEQEKIIGRKKFENTKLSPENKYANAHNAILNPNEENASDTKILRSNVIFSNPSQNQFGTFFIAYSRNFQTVENMLKNMFLGSETRGTHDKLLEYSSATTGTLFFVPSFSLISKFSQEEIF